MRSGRHCGSFRFVPPRAGPVPPSLRRTRRRAAKPAVCGRPCSSEARSGPACFKAKKNTKKNNKRSDVPFILLCSQFFHLSSEGLIIVCCWLAGGPPPCQAPPAESGDLFTDIPPPSSPSALSHPNYCCCSPRHPPPRPKKRENTGEGSGSYGAEADARQDRLNPPRLSLRLFLHSLISLFFQSRVLKAP